MSSDALGVCLGPVIEVLLHLCCSLICAVGANIPAAGTRTGRRAEQPRCVRKCCGLFRFVFCCARMRRKHRVILSASWIILIFSCLLLIFKFGLYSPWSGELAPADELLIEKHASTKFCDSVSIRSDKFISTYRTSGKPGLANSSLSYATFNNFSMTNNAYRYWAYNLLKFSVYSFGVCTSGRTNFYLIKGERNMRLWKESSCYHCDMDLYSRREIISRYSYACDSPADFIQVTGDVDETDMFFFAIVNEDSVEINGQIQVNLLRTRYDLGSNPICRDATSCEVKLKFDSKQKIILQATLNDSGNFLYDKSLAQETLARKKDSSTRPIPNTRSSDRGNEEAITNIHISCSSNSIMYIIIFLVLPLIVILIFSLCVWCFCKDQHPEHKGDMEEELLATKSVYGSTVNSRPDVPYENEIEAIFRK